MQLVETITVGAGGAASIEFTGIPQDGTDLLLTISERHSVDGNTRLTFNGSASGYTQRRLHGTGSSVSSTTNSTIFLFMEGQDASYTSSTFSNGAAYIPNYTSATAKSVSWDYVTENNATTADQMILAGTWSGTDAITSISLGLPSGVFEQHTTASLYKVTKA